MPTISPDKLLAYVEQQISEWRLSSKAADEWDGSAAAATAAEMMRDLQAAVRDGSLNHEPWWVRLLDSFWMEAEPISEEQREARERLDRCGDPCCPACRMPGAVKP